MCSNIAYLLLLVLVNLCFNQTYVVNDYCDQSSNQQQCDDSPHNIKNKYTSEENVKYVLYDISLNEGFNLRRDVFMRMASVVNSLAHKRTLVLPQWSSLPHWTRNNRYDSDDHKINSWSTYFDVSSLSKYVSVIEYEQFIANNSAIDVIIALENFADSFEDEGINWREHYQINDCNSSRFYAVSDNGVQHLFETDENIEYKRLVCVPIEGFVTTLKEIIELKFAGDASILISNAEVILHSNYGDANYWRIRRSMRFNSKLISIADEFRHTNLNSDDITDNTILDNDWRSMKRTHGHAFGGQYLAVHLRRSDFAKFRPKDVPNIECAVKQIHFAITQYLQTNHLFISSDADDSEWLELSSLLKAKNIKVFRFISDSLTDGEIAIIDQWIASHAKLFIGTYDSTFSFRIQEEREILGFLPNTTFNAFCAKCDHRLMLKLCKQESQWNIVYD